MKFVENGEEALKSLANQPFDLILMDMQMPVMDGLSATQTIRQREQATGQIQSVIIALTANARPEDVERCQTAGCTAHLSKPIDKAKLISTIEHYLPKVVPAAKPTLGIELPPGIEEAAKRYLRSRQNDIGEMKQLVDEHNFCGLQVLAHNMKGTTPYNFPRVDEDRSRLGSRRETRRCFSGL